MAVGSWMGAAQAAEHRMVVIAASPGDPRAVQQRQALAKDAGALDERDVVVKDTTPDALRHDRPDLQVHEFTVLLIGKDGGVKLHRDEPVDPAEITALIDTMPMRRAEMRDGARHP